MRIDLALSHNLENYSRSQVKILLVNKKVKKTNKIITEPSYKVKYGDIFFVSIDNKLENKSKPEDIKIDIIYEDRDLIIVNKKAGMITHPAPGNKNSTLVNALLHHTNNKLSDINGINRPGIVHRLDKDTSGLLVIAKNNNSHNLLSQQFKDHSITRKYLAVIWGIPENQIIKGYIERDKINRKRMKLNKLKKGKYSETILRLKKSFKIASLIECKLNTGRTHQIRVHMSSINHPLVGDKVYERKIEKYKKNISDINKFMILKNFNRQALHAFNLGFIHPRTKKYIEFKSDLPLDMLNLLDYIVKY